MSFRGGRAPPPPPQQRLSDPIPVSFGAEIPLSTVPTQRSQSSAASFSSPSSPSFTPVIITAPSNIVSFSPSSSITATATTLTSTTNTTSTNATTTATATTSFPSSVILSTPAMRARPPSVVLSSSSAAPASAALSSTSSRDRPSSPSRNNAPSCHSSRFSRTRGMSLFSDPTMTPSHAQIESALFSPKIDSLSSSQNNNNSNGNSTRAPLSSPPLPPPPSLRVLQSEFAAFALTWRHSMQWEISLISSLETSLESFHQLNRNTLCLFEILEQLQERESGYEYEHYNYLTGINEPASSENSSSEELSWMIQKRSVNIHARNVNFQDESTAKNLLIFIRTNPSILGLLVLIDITSTNEELVLHAIGSSIFGREKELLYSALNRIVSMSVRNDVKFVEELGSQTPKSFVCKLLQFCIKRAGFDILSFFTEKLEHFICLGELLSANLSEDYSYHGNGYNNSSFRGAERERGESFLQPRSSEKRSTSTNTLPPTVATTTATTTTTTTNLDSAEKKRGGFRSFFSSKKSTSESSASSSRARTNSVPDLDEVTLSGFRVPQWRKSLICQACEDVISVLKEVETLWHPTVFQVFKVLFEVGTKQKQDITLRRILVRSLLLDGFLFPALIHPERSGALTGRRLLPREQANLLVLGEVLSCIFVSACGTIKLVNLEAPPNVRDAVDAYVSSKQREATAILDRIIERTQQFTPKRRVKSELFFSVEMPWQELKALDFELRRALKEVEINTTNNSPGNLLRSLSVLASASYPEEPSDIKAREAEKQSAASKLDKGNGRRATTVVKEPRKRSAKPISRKYTVFKLASAPSPLLQDLDSFLRRFFVDRNALPTSPFSPVASPSSRVRFTFASSSAVTNTSSSCLSCSSSFASASSLDLQPLVRLFCNTLWCEKNYVFDDIHSLILHSFQPLSTCSSFSSSSFFSPSSSSSSSSSSSAASHTDKQWHQAMTISALLQNLRAQDILSTDSTALRASLHECLLELKSSFELSWNRRREDLQEAIQEVKIEMERLSLNILHIRNIFLHRRVLKMCGELEVPLKLQLPSAFCGHELVLEFANIPSFVKSFRGHHYDFLQSKNKTFASAVFHAFTDAAQTQLLKKQEEITSSSSGSSSSSSGNSSSDSALVLEKYISLELFSSMFCTGASPDFPSERDEKLMSKIRELSWLTPSALGLPKTVCESIFTHSNSSLSSVSNSGRSISSSSLPWVIEPILQLRRLEYLWSPSEKLICLQRVAKSIVLHLQLICNISTIDADTFLGALILVIVQGSPVRILANLEYIKTFGPVNMSGEETYCCNQFDIALAYIKKTSSIPARVPIATSTVVFSYPNFLFGLMSCLETKQCVSLMLVCSRIQLVIHREPRLFCVCFPTEPTLLRPLTTLQHPLMSPHGRAIQLPAPKAIAIRVKLTNLPRSSHANERYFVALYTTEQHCPFSFQYAAQTSAVTHDPNRISNLHLVHYPTSPDPLLKLVVMGMDTFSEFVVGQVTCKMVRVLGRGFVEQALMGPEDILDSVKSVGTLCIEVSPPDNHPPVSSALPEQIQANVSIWFKHVEDFLTVSKEVVRVQVHGSAHSVVGPVGEISTTEVATLVKPVPRRLRFEKPLYFDQAAMVRKPPPVVEVGLLVKQLLNKEMKTPNDKPVDSIATASLNGPRDLCAHWGIWQAYDMRVLSGENYKKHMLLKPHFTGTICFSISIQNLSTSGAFVAARQAGLFVCQTEPVMSSSPKFVTPLLVRLDRQPSLGPLTQHLIRHQSSTGSSTRLSPPFVDLYVFSPARSVIDLQADFFGFVQISLPDALARILSMGSLEMTCPIITLDSAGNASPSNATMQCVLSCSVDNKTT